MRWIKATETCHERLQLARWSFGEFGMTTGWLATGPNSENAIGATGDTQTAARRMASVLSTAEGRSKLMITRLHRLAHRADLLGLLGPLSLLLTLTGYSSAVDKPADDKPDEVL